MKSSYDTSHTALETLVGSNEEVATKLSVSEIVLKKNSPFILMIKLSYTKLRLLNN